MRIRTLAAVAVLSITTPAFAVDWKMYGGSEQQTCFYDADGAASVANRTVRVWAECVADKDIDAAVNADLASKKGIIGTDAEVGIIGVAARRKQVGYVPPLSRVDRHAGDVNGIIIYEAD